jgi:hypothetical protein
MPNRSNSRVWSRPFGACSRPTNRYSDRAGQDGAPAGRRTVKTDPLLGSLVTVTSPPIIRASLRVMASPRPVPPKRCAARLGFHAVGLAQTVSRKKRAQACSLRAMN